MKIPAARIEQLLENPEQAYETACKGVLAGDMESAMNKLVLAAYFAFLRRSPAIKSGLEKQKQQAKESTLQIFENLNIAVKAD